MSAGSEPQHLLYENLSFGIILQAYVDMRRAAVCIPPGREYRNRRQYNRHVFDECKAFFEGAWYSTMTACPQESITKGIYAYKRSKVLHGFDKAVRRDRMRQHRQRVKGYNIAKKYTHKSYGPLLYYR